MPEIQIRDKKAMKITVVCLLVSLIGMYIFLGWKLVQWKDYVPVEAMVEGICVTNSNRLRENSQHTEVLYSFRLNGQDYTASRTEWFQGQSGIGEVRTIRCNPENPEELEDVWVRNTSGIMLIVLTIVLILMVIGLHRARKSAYRYPEKTSSNDPSQYF